MAWIQALDAQIASNFKSNPLAVWNGSNSNHCDFYTLSLIRVIRSFEKGLADKGGWRQEIFLMPEIRTSFLYPFSHAPLGEGRHNSGDLLLLFVGPVSRQPPPANPFLKPLRLETICLRFRWHSAILNCAIALRFQIAAIAILPAIWGI